MAILLKLLAWSLEVNGGSPTGPAIRQVVASSPPMSQSTAAPISSSTSSDGLLSKLSANYVGDTTSPDGIMSSSPQPTTPTDLEFLSLLGRSCGSDVLQVSPAWNHDPSTALSKEAWSNSVLIEPVALEEGEMPTLEVSNLVSPASIAAGPATFPTGRLRQPETPEQCRLDVLERTMRAVRDSEFGSLDCLVAEYYTANMDGRPEMALMRRLDRNRRLPHLLASLQRDLPTWTQWEAQAYKDEILRSTESIIAAERASLGNDTELEAMLRSTLTTGASLPALTLLSDTFQTLVSASPGQGGISSRWLTYDGLD